MRELRARLARLECEAEEHKRKEAEYRRAEEALRISEARMAGIVAISGEAIISADDRQRITLFNSGAEKIFGYAAAEVVGQPLEILLPEQPAGAHRRSFQCFAASAAAMRPMNGHGEISGRRKDGTEFPAEASISKFEVAGETIFCVRLRDISGSKRMQQEHEELLAREQSARRELETAMQKLAESESRFRRVVESNMIGISFTGADGTLAEANDAFLWLLGYTREDAGARKIRWDEVTPPEFRSADEAAAAEMAQKGMCTPYEKQFLRKDGTRVSVLLGAASLDRDKRTSVGFALDITDRKRSEQELVRLKERLTALVEASTSLLSSLDLEEVLPGVLDLARRLIYADAYAVWRKQSPSGEWRIVSAVGLSENQRSETVDEDEAYLPDAPLAIEDVLDNPIFARRRETYRNEGIASMLIVPLLVRGAKSGSITFYYRNRRRFSEADIQVASALRNLAASAIATAELYEEQRRMRKEAEEAERRSAFLAEAGPILASSLDYETTLASVARLSVPHIADWCAVDMIEEDGSVRQLAVAHIDPVKVKWAKELRRRYPPDPNAPRGVPNVLRTGRPEISSEVEDSALVELAVDGEHLRMMRELGLKSYMCVPLQARGRTLGAITFISAESGRRYGPRDLALARSLASRAALAVDNARLYATAQRERAGAETALAAQRQSEAKFRRLVDSGIIGIVLGTGDRIVEANGRFLEMVGYSRDDLAAGKLLLPALTPPEYHPADMRAREELLARGASTPFEMEYIRKDGERVPALVGAALLESEPELSFMAFTVDLTERKHLEQRLRESQKLESIGLLAGGIAHDFNNLLTGIMGNASMALDDVPRANPARSMIENVILASQRAADLTRQLLAYSGKGRFVVEPVHLSRLIQEIVNLVRTSLPKKVQLVLDLTEDLPAVEADASQIQQLIMNLVINAAEAIGGDNGIVLVGTGTQDLDDVAIRTGLLHDELATGEYVWLEVHDTGCGMDEETKSKIFDPFFTTKFTGRGLGLAAALGIVRGHRGDIKVYSAPGRGSTFKVLLPVATGRALPAKPPRPRADLMGAGTILVVDDEEIVRQTAKAALERYGYRVVLAENGQQSIEVFNSLRDEVAVILLDMAMPVMSGEEALVHLNRIRPGVHVIVSSGYNEVEAIRRFGREGIASFIQKPYSAAQLAAKMKEILEKSPATGAAGG